MTNGGTGRIILLVVGLGVAVGASALFGACSSDKPAATNGTTSGGPSGSSGTSGVDGATGDSGIDATTEDSSTPQCAALALGGTVVNATYVPGITPDDTGGTLTPGTYDLTALEVYLGSSEDGDIDSGPPGGLTNSAQSTLVVTANTIHTAKISTTLSITTPLQITIATVRVDGVSLATDNTCPNTDSRSTPFTATGNTITMHTAQTRREVYTRRP